MIRERKRGRRKHALGGGALTAIGLALARVRRRGSDAVEVHLCFEDNSKDSVNADDPDPDGCHPVTLGRGF
jgi:hypothetical protein